jgi:putative DNA methylase
MNHRKKLIEVALPLKAINDESALRKRKAPAGYPTTLHKWWAQRPLAACRAVLFASLVDDPDSDPAYLKPDKTVDEERAGIKRAQLFDLIEELVRWENSNNSRVINQARAEIARCVASHRIELGDLSKETIIFGDKKGKAHPKGAVSGGGITAWEILLMQARPEVVNAFLAEFAPPVLDPFCGGGSIPLEAQRLGLRAFASDLNPVPVLITRALIEIPPKFAGRSPVNPDWQAESEGKKVATIWQGAQGLAEDVRYYGQWMRDEAEKRIGHLYPAIRITKEMTKERPDLREYIGQELTVIAWLWARTVSSPSPVYQSVHVPLVRGYWLSQKTGKQAWVEPVIDRANKTYHFLVHSGTPATEQKRVIAAGTKLGRGCRFKCLLSGDPIPEDHVKSEGVAGRLGVRLIAIVAEGKNGRVYLSPTEHHEHVASSVLAPTQLLAGIDSPIALDKRAIWCLLYGLDRFDKLFTCRQLVMLTTLVGLLHEAREMIARASHEDVASPRARRLPGDNSKSLAYSDAIAVYLACALARSVDYNSSLASWRPKDNAMRSTFAKQGLPMVWDFAEANPLEKSSAGFAECARVIAKCVEILPANLNAEVKQLDATAAINGIPSPLVCTDPPYYDNIGYADLSDYFYVWLRRSIAGVYPSLFSTLLTPKAQELIASPYRHGGDKEKAKEFFEDGLGQAFRHIHEKGSRDFPIPVFYAFKQSESAEDDDGGLHEETSTNTTVASTGWETMLEGLIKAGFSITGTWPMRTEGDNRQVGIGANALASSIVLICRPRPEKAPLATRKEFMNALRGELPEALKNLQHGNIAPVDLAQAAIGPGMAVFTRYSKVIETDGSSMTVRTALGIINQVLDEVLAEQEGEFDADTRWALAWFEQFGTAEGPYGVAETLSKAKNTAVGGLVEARIVKARAGKVQLIGRDALPEDWNPATDKRLTVWETTQHLIRALEKKGEVEAASLLNKLGGMAETARDLAYRLYSMCEKKKWSDEALAFNGLVIAWPELTKLAISERTRQPSTQQDLFS